MYQKMLVAVDGSEASYHALEAALNLSKQLNAAVESIFVFHPQLHSQMIEKHVTVTDEAGKSQIITLAEQEEREIQKRIQEIGNDAGVTIPYHHIIGNVTDEIINAAKKCNAELIVIGSTGKGVAGRILLGSTSAAVVEKSPLPVLVTRK
ncbi:MAG: universal stress protein [Methanospirillaceae archaeon]|nr:universal stress protein [Methanospirillaceae archaeon]